MRIKAARVRAQEKGNVYEKIYNMQKNYKYFIFNSL